MSVLKKVLKNLPIDRFVLVEGEDKLWSVLDLAVDPSLPWSFKKKDRFSNRLQARKEAARRNLGVISKRPRMKEWMIVSGITLVEYYENVLGKKQNKKKGKKRGR